MSERTGCEADDCRGILLRAFADLFGIEAYVTTEPPLVPPAYVPLDLRCRHGVLWFAEPTGEQIVKWVEGQVP